MEDSNGEHKSGGIPKWVKIGCLAGVVGGAVVILAPIAFSMLVMAPIALKSFGKADVRSDVARAMSDLRGKANALEMYFIDNSVYPPTELRTVLTTPISYMRMLQNDPFLPADQKIPYNYLTTGDDFIVFSVGPDKDADIESAAILKEGEAALKLKSYDATNGTKSSGDIWRTSNLRF